MKSLQWLYLPMTHFGRQAKLPFRLRNNIVYASLPKAAKNDG